ncbi:hypothetical protein Ait01nite_033720 [Actinoplanes italicus]|uniref:Trypsin-like peptidase n=1 Tax=Actinoplanes italicus TaxID=113567 RepID=A0A2T0K3H0_9ACTN|nr:hypothetical protein [Actinoplanes italicus]PRX17402.1 hypothetical protein CLV67_116178 [Actinoplanes italicus]GIE30327.1 hypothetical protein Ait01nite_033720 [Actinoplanes italicus]
MSDISVPDELGYLVRITDETGKVLGTGITVAAGRVLTSLHLVGPRMLADPDTRIHVTPAAGGPPLPAVIGFADGELDLAMLHCAPRARHIGRIGSSRDIEVGGNVEVLVPSDEDIPLRLETEWLGSHAVDQSGQHSHVRAPREHRELGLHRAIVARDRPARLPRPGLAAALSAYATAHAAADRIDEARPPMAESLAIVRGLAASDRNAHLPDLAEVVSRETFGLVEALNRQTDRLLARPAVSERHAGEATALRAEAAALLREG